MAAEIVVVGACNMDLTSYVARLPQPGETLHGREFKTGFGGKGANQCIMAAKLGAKVAMVAKLGRDAFATDMLANFQRHQVVADHITQTEAASTGVAPIAVEDSGQNSIIICNGANDLLTPADAQRAEALIKSAKVVICQNEIKAETSLEALRLAKKNGVLSIFNFAPATTEAIDPEFYSLPDIFCANETETAMATGLPVTNIDEAKRAAQWLHKEKNVKTVLLTLGAQGSLLSTNGGDAFLGALGFYLARMPSLSLEEMTRRSGAIATVSVTKHGTQSSYPDKTALPASLF